MIIKVFASWLLLMLIAPFFGEQVAIFAFSNERLVSALGKSDVKILSAKNHMLIVATKDVVSLYKNGAFLVLPASKAGCVGDLK